MLRPMTHVRAVLMEGFAEAHGAVMCAPCAISSTGHICLVTGAFSAKHSGHVLFEWLKPWSDAAQPENGCIMIVTEYMEHGAPAALLPALLYPPPPASGSPGCPCT